MKQKTEATIATDKFLQGAFGKFALQCLSMGYFIDTQQNQGDLVSGFVYSWTFLRYHYFLRSYYCREIFRNSQQY